MSAAANKVLAVTVPAPTARATLETSLDGFGHSPVHPLQQRLADHFASPDAFRHPDDYAWGAKAAIIMTASLTVWAALGIIAYLLIQLG